MEKLLGCPFCGGDAQVDREGAARQSAIVGCTECHCQLESNEIGSGNAWNTRALANSGDAQAVAALDTSKIVSVTRAFDYLGNNEHTPWVKVCFPNGDWAARDAFAKFLASPPAQAESATSGACKHEPFEGRCVHCNVEFKGSWPAIAPQRAELVGRFCVLAGLVREVMHSHADKESCDYNTCDDGLCAWCETAAAALSGWRSA